LLHNGIITALHNELIETTYKRMHLSAACSPRPQDQRGARTALATRTW
jgi:hypothetical protein